MLNEVSKKSQEIKFISRLNSFVEQGRNLPTWIFILKVQVYIHSQVHRTVERESQFRHKRRRVVRSKRHHNARIVADKRFRSNSTAVRSLKLGNAIKIVIPNKRLSRSSTFFSIVS